MSPEDEEARKRRAEELRAKIRDAGSGKRPDRTPTPREITDEAARKAHDEAKGNVPDKDGSSD
jgi:hypothetical protein